MYLKGHIDVCSFSPVGMIPIINALNSYDNKKYRKRTKHWSPLVSLCLSLRRCGLESLDFSILLSLFVIFYLQQAKTIEIFSWVRIVLSHNMKNIH